MPCCEGGNSYYVDGTWSRDGERLRQQVTEFFDHLAAALERSQLTGEGLMNENPDGELLSI